MEQLTLVAPPMEKDVYIEHLIYQPETAPQMKPWAVSIQGWSRGKKTVTIYHEHIGKTGQGRFANLNIKDPVAFANFVSKMMSVYLNTLHVPFMQFRAIDLIALRDGYVKGVNDTKRFRIV